MLYHSLWLGIGPAQVKVFEYPQAGVGAPQVQAPFLFSLGQKPPLVVQWNGVRPDQPLLARATMDICYLF